MVDIILKTLLIMGILLTFAVPGFLMKKANLVKTDSLYTISNILLYIAQPALTIKAFAVNPIAPDGRILLNFLYVALFSAAAIFLTFFASKLVFRFMKKEEEKKQKDILTFVSTFSNCAFVGIPFIDMFTGGNAEAMMYVIVFTVVFNFFVWTLGAYLITQDKSQISLKKALLNPCTIGSAVGLLLFLVPQINLFNMPAVKDLQQLVVYTGGMTAPLSMLIVGVRVADLPAKQLFGNRKIYLTSAMRLIVSPLLSLLLILPFKFAGLFPDDPYVLLAPVISMSMPPAASVVVFAEKFEGEREFAAADYATGTLLAIATLPFILLLVTL